MKTIAMAVLLSTAAVGFIGWRVYEIHTQTVNHFAVLGDASSSYTGGCAAMVASAEAVLRAAASASSTLTVLVTGDGATANEPRELNTYSIPTSRRVIEGRHAKEQRQLAVLRDIAAKCSAIRPTSTSPVFMAVREGIAVLRARGCREGSHCELRVSSDLEENVDPQIKAQLSSQHGPDVALRRTLNNAGIEVLFCGLAATGGGAKDPSRRAIGRPTHRDSNRGARLEQTWSQLFANPEIVRFEPFCSNPRDPQLSDASGLVEREGTER